MRSLLRPGGVGRGVVAGLVALTFMAAGLAAGSWVGWRLAGPLPGITQAEVTAFAADPQLRVIGSERANHLFAYGPEDDTPARWLLGGDGYEAGYTRIDLETNDAYQPVFDKVRRALEEDGWECDVADGELRAVRNDVALALSPVVDGELRGVPDPKADLALILLRNEPLPTVMFLVLGALSGLLLGWAVGVTLSAGRAGTALVLTGSLLAMPATALTLASAVLNRLAPVPISPAAGWWAYMTVGVRPLALLGAVLLIAAGVTAGFRRTGKG
ncbi:hypothetical protein ACIA8K_04770 [Catenuloplanes sp. NPDC051500]|uniref:hypothetical protein n=1 Tax=Catenuloplanes sp. NPDC051500 TaxID=3363959 RepID=UPI00379B8CAA